MHEDSFSNFLALNEHCRRSWRRWLIFSLIHRPFTKQEQKGKKNDHTMHRRYPIASESTKKLLIKEAKLKKQIRKNFLQPTKLPDYLTSRRPNFEVNQITAYKST